MNELVMPDRIEGERIYLQRLVVEHAPSLFQVIEAERERLERFLPWVPKLLSLDDEERFLESLADDWERQKVFGFGIFAFDYDFFLGNISVFNLSFKNRRCELGYWVREAGEGKGYASAAVRLLEKVLFGAGFHRLEIRTEPDNNRSEAIPRRCGYVLDGCLRQHWRVDDDYRDILVFSKLNPDDRKEVRGR